MYRANGTGKSSEASLPFLNARLVSHRSPLLLQHHAREVLESIESNFKSRVQNFYEEGSYMKSDGDLV